MPTNKSLTKTTKQKPQLHYHREDVSVGTDHQCQLDDAWRMLCQMPEPTRAQVAAAVNSTTRRLYAYTGGCHVALHATGMGGANRGEAGFPLGPCVATITGNYWDWV